MRLVRDPVWRGSLVVLLRHYPAFAAAVLVGCAALALSALSGRTFVDAAEVALLRGQVEAVPASAPEDEQGLVRASLFDATSPEVEDAVGEVMADLDGGAPPLEVRRPIRYRDSALRATPYVVSAAGDRAVAALFAATGAVGSLTPAGGSPDPEMTGLWLPDTVAERLGLRAGDPVTLELSPAEAPPTRSAPVEVAGVYATDERGVPRDPTGFWRALADELPDWAAHLEPDAEQLPVLVADTDTYRALAAGVGERSLTTWDVVPAADPVRLADAERLVRDTERLQVEVRDPGSRLSRELNADGTNEVTVFGGLPAMVSAARTGWSATIQGVSAVRVVGMGLSWLVVALAAVALLVRRRGERQVLVDQGRSPVELALLTVVEVLVPVGLGLAAGLWASGPFVERVVGQEGTPVRPQDTALVAVVALGTVAVASLADALQRHRRTSGRTAAAWRLPWRTAVLTLAAAGAVSAYTGGSDFDTVTAVFPLAAVGAVAVLVSAATAALLARLAARWLPRRLGPRLALSRLARDPSAATALVAATVAFGAVGYGLLFQASAEDAVDDKVAVQAGAASVFGLTDLAAAERLDAVADRSSVVLRTVPTVDGRTRDRLLAVDPATFERAALWSPRLAGGRDLAEVLAPLAPGGDVLPLLLVGDDTGVPAQGTVGEPGTYEVEYRVVERLAAFPGVAGDETVLVADRRALPDAAPASFDVQLWSAYDADTVSAAAEAADLEPRLLSVAAEARAEPSLVARGWVTDYLQAATVLALLLGLLVLAGLHRRDREQRRLQDATLADLGHPRGLASRAAGVELAVVSLLGAGAGGLAAYAVTRSLADRLDPLPDLRPALVVTGTGRLLLAAAVFVAAALLLTLLAGRLGRARSVNELLHDE